MNYSHNTHLSRNDRDSGICSSLKDNLRQQYRRRSIRVVKGDSIRVMRGEYAGVEGKVEKVNTERGTLSIEGIQREKVRGGNVKVQIHASSVIVTSLHLDDKRRQTHLQAAAKTEKISGEKPIKKVKKAKARDKKVRGESAS